MLTRQSQYRSAERGFTILELLVSVAIFTIVMGTIYALLRVGSSDRFTTNQRADILQNARVALNTLGVDVQNAGFAFDVAILPDNALQWVGLPLDADTSPDRLYPIVPGNDLKTNTLSGIQTDIISFASIDDSWNLDAQGTPQPILIDAHPGGNQLRTPTTDGMAPVRAGELYVVSDDVGDTIGWCTQVPPSSNRRFANFSSSDPLGINQPGSSGQLFNKNLPCAMTKLRWVAYWVEPDGTFVRAVFGDPGLLDGNGAGSSSSTGFLVMPLATGVEDFQVEYVIIDNNTQVVTSAPTTAQIPNIRQVRFSLRVRGAEIDQRFREPFRTTLTSTFNARNVGTLR